MPAPHPLERRVEKLSQALGQRVEIISRSLGGPQERRPFHEVLSDRDALAFWRRHRYDSIGQQVLARMDPRDVLELDTALQRALDAERQAGLPMVSEPVNELTEGGF